MRIVPKRLRWMGLGAVAAWLFDPERGRTRRAQLADQFSAVMRKTGAKVDSKSRYAADKVQGAAHTLGVKSDSSPAATPDALPERATANTAATPG